MRKVYGILFFIMMVCVSCEWQLKPNNNDAADTQLKIERYDRIESLYLSTGDYSALQQMNSSYPMQTRMLIEDILRIGKVDDPDINVKFLRFFQDSTLQTLLKDVQKQYSDMEDLSSELSSAFIQLKEELPNMELPLIYTQIGSFDQSIVVGNNTLGISLDKYLGADYPFYLENYSDDQRRMMVRSMIVPDCLAFYILSLYPISHDRETTREERDRHMARIQWVVNRVLNRKVFDNDNISEVEKMMNKNKKLTVADLLSMKKF